MKVSLALATIVMASAAGSDRAAESDKLTVVKIKEILLHRGGIKIDSIMRMCNEDNKEHSTLSKDANSLCQDFVNANTQANRPGYDVIEYLPHYFLNEPGDIYR